ncbi:MAG: ribokinase [Granulosicoccaceae bacterium]
MFYNLGSINLDHVYRVNHFVQPGETLASLDLQTLLGGKGANQSLALARAGVLVRHIGGINRSDNWAVNTLTDSGVDVSCVLQTDEPSGHAIIQVDAAGENSIILHGGANQALSDTHIESSLAMARPGDWLLMQNECNGLELAMDIAKNKQMRVAFNPAPMSENVQALPLADCAVLIVNEIEAAQLSGMDNKAEATAALLDRFPDVQLVLTEGSRGAGWHFQNQHEFVAAHEMNVVDTTAAGDTFVGYFLATMQSNNDATAALIKACAASALAVTVVGASTSIPTMQAVEHFAAITHKQ